MKIVFLSIVGFVGLALTAILLFQPASYFLYGVPEGHTRSSYCKYLVNDWPTRSTYTCGNLHMCVNEMELQLGQYEKLQSMRKSLSNCADF